MLGIKIYTQLVEIMLDIRHCPTERGFHPDKPTISSKKFIQKNKTISFFGQARLKNNGFTLAGHALYHLAVL